MVGNNKTLQAEIDESGEIYKDLRQDRAYCANMMYDAMETGGGGKSIEGLHKVQVYYVLLCECI